MSPKVFANLKHKPLSINRDLYFPPNSVPFWFFSPLSEQHQAKEKKVTHQKTRRVASWTLFLFYIQVLIFKHFNPTEATIFAASSL